MAKTAPPVEAPPVPGMTAADREWVKEQIDDAAGRVRDPEMIKARLRAAADATQAQRAWVRREIALAAAGVSEAEREEMNP